MVATSISSIKHVGVGTDERKVCSLASLLRHSSAKVGMQDQHGTRARFEELALPKGCTDLTDGFVEERDMRRSSVPPSSVASNSN